MIKPLRCWPTPPVFLVVRHTYSADPLLDARQVHLLPVQRVGVALVDVVIVDLGAAAVFGALPGHSHGRAVTAQHGDAKRCAGRR